MRRGLSFLLAFALMFTGLPNLSFAAEVTKGTRPEDGVTREQPFAPGTGTSQQFRIPCLVSLDDGTIVAGCDARWNTIADGGGLDTIVSYSKDNGETWHYTFANYLGDNGNTHNNGSSSFIDPAMATDGKTVYMIADLYPAGYALNGAHHAPHAGQNGLNAKGELRLASAEDADANQDGSVDNTERGAADYDAYHLEKASENVDEDASEYYLIKDQEGKIVEGYEVDAYFNIKGKNVDTNLFLQDSPFITFPTDYLYFTSSEDGGATWSIPSLLNLKRESEQSLLVGPGNGIVTKDNRILFTAYEFTGSDKNSAAIYSDDGGKTWHRGASVSGWSSEATVAEVGDKLYMFTRHGNAYYVSNDGGATWGPQKSTGLTYNSNCQISVISYSKEIDGKPAVLFSVPSSTSSRSAGRIHVGLIQEDDTIDWAYEYDINGSAYYAYSCIEELVDGSIGLLYENAGSQITYINIPIEDIAKGSDIDLWFMDENDKVIDSLDLGSNDQATVTVKKVTTDSVIQLVSGNDTYLDVKLDGDVLTVSSSDIGEGFVQTEITVTDGTRTAVLPVNIVGADQYEIVSLHVGETAVYTDPKDDYSSTNVDKVSDNALVTLKGQAAPPSTEITFKGLKEGNSSVKIGDITYYIAVTYREEALKLKVGQKKAMIGAMSVSSNEERAVSVSANDALYPYAPADTLEDGFYLFGNTANIMVNTANTAATPHGMNMKLADFYQGDYSQDLWKVTKAEGQDNGYTMQDVNNRYLNFEGQKVFLSETPQTLTIAKAKEGGFTVGHGGQYLNNYGGFNSKVAGYGSIDGNSRWNFYQLSKGYEVQGLKEGKAVFVVGDVRYFVTVEGMLEADYSRVDELLKLVPKKLATSCTEDTAAALQKVIDDIDRSLDYTKQDEVDAYVTALEEAIENLVYIYEVSFVDTDRSSLADTQRVQETQKAEEPQAPSKTGYQFKGWMVKGGDGELFDFTTPVNEDLMLIAVWEADKYSVTFDTVIDAEDIQPMEVEYDQTVELPTPEKEGYQFKGWLFEGASFDPDTKVAGDMNLVADWQVNAPIPSKEDGSVLKVGDAITFECEAKESVIYYTMDGTVPNKENGILYQEPLKMTEAGNVTIKAMAEAENVKPSDVTEVSYTVQEESKPTSGKEALSEAIEEAGKLNKEEYTKDSWAVLEEALNAAKEVAGKADAKQEEIAAALAGLTDALSKLQKKDVAEEAAYTVSFLDTDGSAIYEARKMAPGSILGEIADPVKEGYIFRGWFADTQKVEVTTYKVTEDLVLTAKWLFLGEVADNEEDTDKILSSEVIEIADKIWAVGIKTVTYNGSKHTFPIRIYDGTRLLEEKTDYTITYKNNQNANNFAYTAEELEELQTQADQRNKQAKAVLNKLPQVIIKMKGQYKGTRAIYFKILPVDFSVSGNGIIAQDVFVKDNGKVQKPKVTVTFNGKKLKTNEFTLTPKAGSSLQGVTPAGEPIQLTVTGKGNFTGSTTVDMTIFPKNGVTDMSKAKVTLPNKGKVVWTEAVKEGYEFSTEKNEIQVKIGKNTISSDCYTVSYENNDQAGTATLVIRGVEDKGYYGEKRINFKIEGTQLKKMTAENLQKTYIYTGKEIKPLSLMEESGKVILKAGGNTLTKEDYTAVYSNNVVKGKATITITGNPKEGYEGSKKLTFTIKQAPISGTDITFTNGESNTTAEIVKGGARPEVVVRTKAGKVLREGIDYTLTYSANKAEGSKGKVTVKGKGNYNDKKELFFDIVKKSISSNDLWVEVKDKAIPTAETNKWSQKIKIYDADGKALKAGKDYDKQPVYTLLKEDGSEDHVLTAGESVPAGSVIRVSVKGLNSYGADSNAVAETTYRIIPKTADISKAKITVAAMEFYKGNPITLEEKDVTVALAETTLTEGKDFVVVRYQNNSKIGKAKVTIQGIGTFGGSKTVTFKIEPRSVGTEADNWWKEFMKFLFTWKDNVLEEETPSGNDTPSGDTSGNDTPSGDTSGNDTPAGDTSGNDTPGSNVPGEVPQEPAVFEDYSIYPIPQSLVYGEGGLTLTSSVAVVAESGIDKATTDYVEEVLKEFKVAYEMSDSMVDGKTNILLGIKGSGQAAEAYINNAKIEAASEDFWTKNDAHIVDVKENVIVIYGSDTDSVFHGVSTLKMMFHSVKDGNFKTVHIEDFASVGSRGFIEGFYGSWDHQSRIDLMRFAKDYKMNSYVYAAKGDAYHTNKWADLYPAEDIERFKELVAVGEETKVRFAWSVHTGTFFANLTIPSDEDMASVDYASMTQFDEYRNRYDKLMEKFDQLIEAGVRRFDVLNDDFGSGNIHDVVLVLNRINRDLKEKGCESITYCPQGYNKSWALGGYGKQGNELDSFSNLDEDIKIYWTGDDVNTPITQETVDFVTERSHGHQPDFWLNYPVNEHAKSGIFLGHIKHYARDGVTGLAGFHSNPCRYPYASQVGLYQLAALVWNNNNFLENAETIWESAFDYLQPEVTDAYFKIANHISNAPGSSRVGNAFPESDAIEELLNTVLAEVKEQGNYAESENVAALRAEFDAILSAIEEFKEKCENKTLVEELTPWLNSLMDVAAAGRDIIDSAVAVKTGDLSLAWEKLSSASTAYSTAYTYKANADDPNMAKAGTKRIDPFVGSMITSVSNILTPVLNPDNAEVLPSIFAKVGGTVRLDDANGKKMYDGDPETAAVWNTDQQAGDYIGLDLGRAIKITDVEILQGNNDTDHDIFHNAHLEYSVDNTEWIRIDDVEVTVDGHLVTADNLDITARYIRYYLDETGTPSKANYWTHIREFTVNKPIPGGDRVYTNIEALKETALTLDGAKVSVRNLQDLTLQPGQYIGIKLETPAVAYSFEKSISNETGLTLEYSYNEEVWTNVTETAKDVAVKYLRLINKTEAAVTTNVEKIEASLQILKGEMKLLTSTMNGGVKSGSYDLVFDGERSTFVETNGNQQANNYMTFDLGKSIEVHDVTLVTTDGNQTFSKAKVQISSDNVTWQDIGTINDNMQFPEPPYKFFTCDGNGAHARYLRILITANYGNTLKLHEIELNQTLEGGKQAEEVVTNMPGNTRAVNDNNISTAMTAEATAGSYVEYRISDNTNITKVNILMGAAGSGKAYAVDAAGEKRLLGSLNKSVSEFDTTSIDAAITAIRLEWDKEERVSIHEIITVNGPYKGSDLGVYVDPVILGGGEAVITNIAIGKEVSVSGTSDGNKDKVNDGIISQGSKWDSNKVSKDDTGSETAWIQLDLGAGTVYEINKLIIHYHNKIYPVKYTISVSDDASSWTQVGEERGWESSASLTFPVDTIELDTPVKGRYVKLSFTKLNSNAAGQGVGIQELEIYGKPYTE